MSSSAAATSKPPVKPRAYTRFLTSTLHSRFAHAALIALFPALDTAIFLSKPRGFFWTWFPIGPAGIFTLLYFAPTLCIFMLQVSTLKIGKPTATSPYARTRSILLSWTAFTTIIWHLISAWCFVHVYIFTSGRSDLSWVLKGDLKTSDKLNERPIYLKTFCSLLAFAHALRHLYYSQSNLHVPVAPLPIKSSQKQDTHDVPDVFNDFKQKAKPLIWRVLMLDGIVTLAGPFIYSAFLRQTMWKMHLTLAQPFANLSKAVNERAMGFPPLVGILPTTLVLGIFLGSTWEIATFVFLSFFRQSPLKKDQPLTARSKDPNGTLLNGLKAKRDVVKTFAFWELSIIAQHYPERRKAIFNDIDRPTGPIWASMLEESLKVVGQIDTRISGSKPVTPPPASQEPQIQSLPRVLPPPKQVDVISKTAPRGQSRSARVAEFVAKEVERLGTSPSPARPPTYALHSVETGIASATDAYDQSMSAVKRSPLGWYFATPPTAKLNAQILGSPNGNASIIVDAIESVVNMLVASMQDDAYGKAIRGVPLAVKQFSNTINAMDPLLKTVNSNVADIVEIQIVYSRLKAGLTELLSAFQQFLFDTGLSVSELNDAKKASGQKGIEAAKEQQTPARIEEERPKRVIKASKAKEQNETWREWGSQRRQNAEPVQPLFNQHTLTRKISGGQDDASRPAPSRRREMEQVR